MSEVNVIRQCLFFRQMRSATAWLELLCCQFEAWQKRSKKKR